MVNLDLNIAYRAGHVVRLQPQQAVILSRLVEGPQTHDKLVSAVYGATEPKDPYAIIKNRLKELRHKLEPLGVAILNRYGKGYSLVVTS